MNLSISNIGWSSNDDAYVYSLMQFYGFTGLEIAPTRVFPHAPYNNLQKALEWSLRLNTSYGFTIPSMQSIWYGQSDRIFGTDDERKRLILYTKKAVDFAEIIGCKNLVFGCPRNRFKPIDSDAEIAIRFFKTIGDYAYTHHTIIAIEANPPIYNTNFLNTTKEAIEFIEETDSKGLLLNLDVGTMIENNETVEILQDKEHLINHVHISEPGLSPIKERPLHKALAEKLHRIKYDRFISIEVSKQDNVGALESMMKYVKKVFEKEF